MKVTSSVTRYSVILPFSTLPLSETTSNPVTPRSVLVARFSPSSVASWNPLLDDAVILLTRATAMTCPPVRPTGRAIGRSSDDTTIRPGWQCDCQVCSALAAGTNPERSHVQYLP